MEKAKKELVVFLALAAISGAFFGWSYLRQPSGHIQINCSQSRSREISRNLLSELGYENISEYETATTFKSRSMVSTYLQLKLPREEARQKIKEYGVRFWETRFYKPKEKEEFRVGVDPVTGNVVKLRHTLREEAPGENLSRDRAFNMARNFLTERGYDLSQSSLIENSVERETNRTDYRFSWRKENRVKNAPFEMDVEVQGGKIGVFSPSLNIPDGFTHDYRSRRAPGIAFNVIFLGAGVVLVIGAIYYSLQYYREGEFDTKYAGILAAIAGGLMVLSMVNSLPGILYNVPTTMSPDLFLTMMVIVGVISGLIYGGLTLAAAGGGREISKEVLDFDVTRNILEPGFDRDRLKYSTFRGFCLAFVLLGFATLFYLVGSRFFGVWMPENSPYLSAVSAYVPALMALTTGGTAAILEESLFRLFSIPFLKRHLKYTAAAVLISAFVWGLGHTAYVVLPWYTRIIEVTILGVILGWAFLRYDLVTVISAHFSMNAFLVGVPLLLAGTRWLRINGFAALIIACIPVLISVGLAILDSGRATDAA